MTSRGKKILSCLGLGTDENRNKKNRLSSAPTAFLPAKDRSKDQFRQIFADDGRVWERYEEHEHSSFLRLIDTETLSKLKNFAFPDEQNDASLPEETVIKVDSAQQLPTLQSGEQLERNFFMSTTAVTKNFESDVSLLPTRVVVNQMQILTEPQSILGFNDLPGPSNSALAIPVPRSDDIVSLHENEEVTIVELVPAELRGKDDLFNGADKKGEASRDSPRSVTDFERALNSDDSIKDPDFDVENYDDFGSNESHEYLTDEDEESIDKQVKIHPQKKKCHRKKHGDPTPCGVLQSSENTSQVLMEAKRSKKNIADPSAWKRNETKKLRNECKQYITQKKNRLVKAREIRAPHCSEKCPHGCKEKFSFDVRKQIFDKYWGLGDVTKQREFICSHTSAIHPEYRYPKTQHRQLNHAFFFLKGEQNRRVCKNFFMATLDINRRTVATAFRKVDDGVVEEDRRGKHKHHKEVPPVIKEGIRTHIKSIPRVESHYLRKQTNREFIEGGKSIASLYRDYKKQCEEENKGFGSLSLYTWLFNHEFNISFFIPKKDQCETCTAYKLADDDQKKKKQSEYDLHQEEKELARLEKQWDKDCTNENVIVCCYDLQAAFPTPQGEASVFYYKSKLSTYNLTIYDVKTGETVNNVWHEGDANRGAIEIATCVYKFIEEKATATEKRLKFIFFSDNCSGQQKNKFVFVMYMLCLRKFKNIDSISHKYLVTGHTQNEGDCVHSVIEKAVKRARKTGPIYVPDQFVQIIRTAKIKEPFYKVRELTFSEFFDFKCLTKSVGGNFTVNTSNSKFPFTDIKMFMVTRSNPMQFQYRTSFDGDLETVNIGDAPATVAVRTSKRARKSNNNSENSKEERHRQGLRIFDEWDFKKAYTSPTGISERKKKDLLSLVNSGVVPECYRKFYEALPTHSQKRRASEENEED